MEVEAAKVGGSMFNGEPWIFSLAPWAMGSQWQILSRGVTYDFCFRKLILEAVHSKSGGQRTR